MTQQVLFPSENVENIVKNRCISVLVGPRLIIDIIPLT